MPGDRDKAAIEGLEKTYNDGFNTRNVDKIMSCYARGTNLFVYDVVPPRAYPSWEAFSGRNCLRLIQARRRT
jgi:hypothetical protein